MRKHKVLSAVLVLSLLAVLLVVPAMAVEGDSNGVAAIGDVTDESLQTAINEAGKEEATIVLQKSVQLETGLTVSVP